MAHIVNFQSALDKDEVMERANVISNKLESSSSVEVALMVRIGMSGFIIHPMWGPTMWVGYCVTDALIELTLTSPMPL